LEIKSITLNKLSSGIDTKFKGKLWMYGIAAFAQYKGIQDFCIFVDTEGINRFC
jgi:hypothetical protein